MKKRKQDNFLISLIFYVHLILVLIWFGLFFVPASFWPKIIEFHFWYITIILISQLIWGIVLYPKIKQITFICPFTTLMQSLRGYPLTDKKNYNHSFIAELFSKLKIKMSFSLVNVILLLSYGIVSVQFIIKNFA